MSVGPTPGSERSERGERGELPPRSLRALVETVALVLLAVVPIIPYLALILDRGVPRFDVIADVALQEYDGRRVWTGDTLLGLGSRWRWSHPGPLLFYIMAPFQKLFGPSSLGLYVGTWCLSAASVGTVVAATRAWAGRVHAAAAVLVVIAWFAAFGNVAANPWVRVVLPLPLFAYIVLGAFLALGAARAAFLAVPFGALVAQTHVLTIPTVGIVGAAALTAFVVRARRRGGITRAERRSLLLAVALLVVVFLPPIIEQLKAEPGEGNFSKLLAFRQGRAAASKSLGAAFDNWIVATAWLPDRVLSASIAEDGWVPLAMRWDAIPASVSRTAWTITIVHALAAAAAVALAYRRRDMPSLVLLAAGLLGEVLAVITIRAMTGQEHYSLLYWTVAPSALVWMGTLSTFFVAIVAAVSPRIDAYERVLGRIVDARALRILVVGIGMVAALAAAPLQRRWLARFPYAPNSDPEHALDRRRLYDAMREHAARMGTIPVIHQEGAFGIAYAFVLEADKDGMDVRIADSDLFAYAGPRRARDGHFTHYWFAVPGWPVRVSGCLEVVATAGVHQLFAAAADVSACDRPVVAPPP